MSAWLLGTKKRKKNLEENHKSSSSSSCYLLTKNWKARLLWKFDCLQPNDPKNDPKERVWALLLFLLSFAKIRKQHHYEGMAAYNQVINKRSPRRGCVILLIFLSSTNDQKTRLLWTLGYLQLSDPKKMKKRPKGGSTSFPPLHITIYNEMTKKQKEVEKRSKAKKDKNVTWLM